ncbi:hypothetical protein NUW58_g3158 [Xylaria curta]|uniref:Uncharacterized protein n=1 Tax=Xylaria curta TaxID=42375 RepID=A0ACC1PC83_9PEZI|nr:hypothetical protein NUW58_g3158 [Xylaria curta]
MPSIDYSKWDNIDVESEPEEGMDRPTPTPKALSSSTLDSVQAVVVRCDVERLRNSIWSAITIPTDHIVFSQPVPPIPELIEIPLVFYRVGTRSTHRADLDNQIITYINIDANSGFAPPEWQSHVGTVITARKDRKSLLPIHLEGIWMYCDHILDLFGEGHHHNCTTGGLSRSGGGATSRNKPQPRGFRVWSRLIRFKAVEVPYG